jgi:pimeloyl-[acyl-carrier protein] methyl ester esterase
MNNAVEPKVVHRLHKRASGSGRDVVLVHGWGMHLGVWEEAAAQLAKDYHVTAVDLPGHGCSTLEGVFTLPEIQRKLLEVAPPQAVWVGWSLGGMACLQLAAAHPERVSGLVMVAASPRFVRDVDWPSAMDATVLAQFAEALEADYRNTLQRFLALQTSGASQGKDTLRRLRSAWMGLREPELDALRGGLAILRDADLRGCLKDVKCPTLLLTGERDTLVPVASVEDIAAQIDQARVHVVPGAGHAPFLSHPSEFVSVLGDFIGHCGECFSSQATYD